MRKVFHLATCSTCQRIIKELSLADHFDLQDIKTEKITGEQLDHMASLSGSYEALFSRRAMKYKSMGLAQKTLGEDDYRQYILDEYTFLKRPVTVWNDEIYIGNAAKTVDKLRDSIATRQP